MAKRARSKWAESERNKLEAPFAPFPCGMVESPAFRTLSGSAFKVLFVLAAVWARNGGLKHNTNGKLIVTYERLSQFWKMSERSIMRAIRELEALGFLVKTVQGCAGNADERQPSQYRLTFLPTAEGVPGTGSHEWRRIAMPEKVIAAEARRAAAESTARRIRRRTRDGSVTDKKHNPTFLKASRSLAQSKAKGVTRDGSVTAFPLVQRKALYISRPLTAAADVVDAADLESVTNGLARGPLSDGEAKRRPAASGRPHCEHCGADIQSRRPDARFCSHACRQKAFRRRERPAAKLAWSTPIVIEMERTK